MEKHELPAASLPCGHRAWRAGVLIALAGAVAAMAALHVLQPSRSPLQQPVSFYVHGASGSLLPLALGLFGVAAWMLSRIESGSSRRLLAIFGACMVVTALIPCDEWFPWEQTPTMSGLVHALLATLAPLLLLRPMFGTRALSLNGRSRFARIAAAGYVVGLVASAASLVVGMARDGPPPFIGFAERVLAVSAVGWLSAMALTMRPAQAGKSD